MGNFSRSWCGTRGSLPTLGVSACEWGTKNKTTTPPNPNQPPSLRALQEAGGQRAPGRNGAAPPAAWPSSRSPHKASAPQQPTPTLVPFCKGLGAAGGLQPPKSGDPSSPREENKQHFFSLDLLELQVVPELGRCE